MRGGEAGGSGVEGAGASVRLGPGAEFDLIRAILRRAGSGARGRPDVRVGPGDDCAVVAGDGIAISSDLSVEGIHFRREWLAPEEIGYRAAAAALSDLAAVAARPIGVLVSLAAPATDVPGVATAVVAGAAEAAGAVGASLLGGDVTASPGPLTLDVVVVGEAGRAVLRTGARPGDVVWVTGKLGGAAAAVAAWQAGAEPAPDARIAFARPAPRVGEALWLRERGLLRALIDLSDGLAGDAAHLAAASGVRIVLEEDAVPVHPAAKALGHQAGLRLALGGGEDYELAFVAPAGAVEPQATAFEAAFGIPLTRVGSVEAGEGVGVRKADGTVARPPVAGFRHFQGGAS